MLELLFFHLGNVVFPVQRWYCWHIIFCHKVEINQQKRAKQGQEWLSKSNHGFPNDTNIFWTTWLEWRMLSLPEIFHKDELYHLIFHTPVNQCIMDRNLLDMNDLLPLMLFSKPLLFTLSTAYETDKSSTSVAKKCQLLSLAPNSG